MAGFRKVSACFVGFVAVNYLCQSVMSNDVTPDDTLGSTSVNDNVGDDSITLSPTPFSAAKIFLHYNGKSKVKEINLNLLKERFSQFLDRIVHYVPKDSTLLPCVDILKENIAIVTKDLPVEFALEFNNNEPGVVSFHIQRYFPEYMAERIANHKFPQDKKTFRTNDWRNLHGMIMKFMHEALRTPKKNCSQGKAQEDKKGDIGKTLEKEQPKNEQ